VRAAFSSSPPAEQLREVSIRLTRTCFFDYFHRPQPPVIFRIAAIKPSAAIHAPEAVPAVLLRQLGDVGGDAPGNAMTFV
jgi:hypothetical protein